jgi:hypothetical protein
MIRADAVSLETRPGEDQQLAFYWDLESAKQGFNCLAICGPQFQISEANLLLQQGDAITWDGRGVINGTLLVQFCLSGVAVESEHPDG